MEYESNYSGRWQRLIRTMKQTDLPVLPGPTSVENNLDGSLYSVFPAPLLRTSSWRIARQILLVLG